MMRNHLPVLAQLTPRALVGVSFIIPPLICWLMLLLSLIGSKRAAGFLESMTSVDEITLLLICPLLSATFCWLGMKRMKRSNVEGKILCRLTVLAGIVLSICAVLASLRGS